jgi:hypothetical protein
MYLDGRHPVDDFFEEIPKHTKETPCWSAGANEVADNERQMVILHVRSLALDQHFRRAIRTTKSMYTHVKKTSFDMTAIYDYWVKSRVLDPQPFPSHCMELTRNLSSSVRSLLSYEV